MRSVCIGLFALSLAACANTGTAACVSTPTPTSSLSAEQQGWIEYEAKVAQERDRGELTPLQAEDSIEDKYRELYGRDPEMEGAFAYSKELYAQAAMGGLALSDAEALATAHENETLARREAEAKCQDMTEYQFPPESSD